MPHDLGPLRYLIQPLLTAPTFTVIFGKVSFPRLAGLGLGFGIIVSSLTTRYRDLAHLVTFGVQLPVYAGLLLFNRVEQTFKGTI